MEMADPLVVAHWTGRWHDAPGAGACGGPPPTPAAANSLITA